MNNRIVLAGGSGFLGQSLAAFLAPRGWELMILSRQPSRDSGVPHIQWDARRLGPWVSAVDGAEAVVNLTGRSVNCRYNSKNRREIMASRVESTQVLGQAIALCANPPKVWLNASTATIYRHTFGEAWDERGEISAAAAARDAFSVEVARAWEKAFAEADTPATRKAALRTAMVLGTGANSVFPVLRRLVRAGLGGRQGPGRQYVSWIHEEDFCRAVEWIIQEPALAGPINVCAPQPLPNAEMMRVLRQVFARPIGLPATRWMLEFGAIFLRTETELILKSRRVIPGRLLASGFQFRFRSFREAAEELETRMSSRGERECVT